MSPQMSIARSRAGVAAKRAKREPSEENLAALEAANRELAEARIAAHITAVVDSAPPLTATQTARLALLLQQPAGSVVSS